ncbi:VOC family protein [Ignavibacterium sp.]|uniref:VOC family protein n=1 Tax=Ignavibacterium sp. TaxID=2651167 RepID=UPI0022042523|nr:VOC family protein [Ignavibacterium sp.]BDQ03525.1 MAG: extradiol dioxygenase [Ignavibacterium sp.]
MTRQIFVNLPVKNVKRSMNFFSQLGFSFNMQFTDDKAACLVIGENIYAMLLHEEFFKTFTKKELADATKVTEVLIAIDVESREAVDSMIQKAVNAGGTIYSEPSDHGWMYQHSFADLDGHQWEVFYSDINALNNS